MLNPYGSEWIFRDDGFSSGLVLEMIHFKWIPLFGVLYFWFVNVLWIFPIVMMEKGFERSFALAERVCVPVFCLCYYGKAEQIHTRKRGGNFTNEQQQQTLVYLTQENWVHYLLALIWWSGQNNGIKSHQSERKLF